MENQTGDPQLGPASILDIHGEADKAKAINRQLSDQVEKLAQGAPSRLTLAPGEFRDAALARAEEAKALPPEVQAVEVTAHGSRFKGAPSPAPAGDQDLEAMDPQILTAYADNQTIRWAMGEDFDRRYGLEISRRLFEYERLRASPGTVQAPAAGPDLEMRLLAIIQSVQTQKKHPEVAAQEIARMLRAGAPSAGRPMTWTREAEEILAHTPACELYFAGLGFHHDKPDAYQAEVAINCKGERSFQAPTLAEAVRLAHEWVFKTSASESVSEANRPDPSPTPASGDTAPALEQAFLNTERGAAVFRVYEAAIAWAEADQNDVNEYDRVQEDLWNAVEESQGGAPIREAKAAPGRKTYAAPEIPPDYDKDRDPMGYFNA